MLKSLKTFYLNNKTCENMKIRIEIEVDDKNVAKLAKSVLIRAMRAIAVISKNPETFQDVLTALETEALEKVEY